MAQFSTAVRAELKHEKVGVYVGSFNPVHDGHLGVLETAINKLQLDKLYVVVGRANDRPGKGSAGMLSASTRAHLVRQAVKSLQHGRDASIEVVLTPEDAQSQDRVRDRILEIEEERGNQVFMISGGDKLGTYEDAHYSRYPYGLIVCRHGYDFDTAKLPEGWNAVPDVVTEPFSATRYRTLASAGMLQRSPRLVDPRVEYEIRAARHYAKGRTPLNCINDPFVFSEFEGLDRPDAVIFDSGMTIISRQLMYDAAEAIYLKYPEIPSSLITDDLFFADRERIIETMLQFGAVTRRQEALDVYRQIKDDIISERHVIPSFTEILKLLQEQGIPSYICSYGSNERVVHNLEKLGLPVQGNFQDYVGEETIGKKDGTPAFMERCLAKLGLEGQRIWYFADEYSNEIRPLHEWGKDSVRAFQFDERIGWPYWEHQMSQFFAKSKQ